MRTYKVLRQHLGDRMYMPGDTRMALPSVVSHLVSAGVLSEEAGEKDAKPMKNKAAKPVANKAE